MPRLTKAVPKYQKHRASGQAVVRLNGQDFYLGPHGTKASKLEYDRVICEWLANGRRSPSAPEDGGITVAELIARFWQFAQRHYRKNGKPTAQLGIIKGTMKPVRELYGRQDVTEFGPLALKAVRRKMIESGHCRNEVNRRVRIVKQCFAWGVSEELIPVAVDQRLRTVAGLREGRTKARESADVRPVPEAGIQATLPYLSPTVSDMVRFQRLTGCRPHEVCMVRPCDLDRARDVWVYRPESHKNEHHGKERIIHVGPKAQAVLMPYLLREADAYCFSPRDSEKWRRAELTAKRTTPLSCGNRIGTNRKATVKSTLRGRYDTNTYYQAIQRACGKANVQRAEDGLEPIERWAPNRLRHSAGTEIRKKFGLEAAQVTLGHASADVTQVYAERDAELAREVARKIG